MVFSNTLSFFRALFTYLLSIYTAVCVCVCAQMGPRCWRKPVLPHNLPVKQLRIQLFLLSGEKWSRSRSHGGVWHVCPFAPKSWKILAKGKIIVEKQSEELIYYHKQKEKRTRQSTRVRLRLKKKDQILTMTKQSEIFFYNLFCLFISYALTTINDFRSNASDRQTR